MARPKAGVTFWDRVHSQTMAGNNSCNVFTGCRDDCGYGRINKDGKLVRLHRETWKLYNGEIPAGMCVCHKCDNPACINPNHLFLGTHQDNMTDKARKGRVIVKRGSANQSSKLKEEQVILIKQRLKNKEQAYALGREYGVTGEAILSIKHGKTWSHL